MDSLNLQLYCAYKRFWKIVLFPKGIAHEEHWVHFCNGLDGTWSDNNTEWENRTNYFI